MTKLFIVNIIISFLTWSLKMCHSFCVWSIFIKRIILIQRGYQFTYSVWVNPLCVLTNNEHKYNIFLSRYLIITTIPYNFGYLLLLTIGYYNHLWKATDYFQFYCDQGVYTEKDTGISKHIIVEKMFSICRMELFQENLVMGLLQKIFTYQLLLLVDFQRMKSKS